MCLCIVGLLYEKIQNHQCNSLIQCETFFTSKLSTNYNNIKQEYYIRSKIEQYTSPKKHIFLIMSPSINTRSNFSESITIYTEATTIST